jgi:heterodisulfide reductase subunit D
VNYNNWTLEMYREWLDMCMHCGACYARGPIVPHNWKTLPPPDLCSPIKKCPSYEYYKFKAYTGQGRLLLAVDTFKNGSEISEDLINIAFSCTSCGICNEVCPTHAPLNVIWALREEINERGCPLPSPLERIYERMRDRHNIFGIEKRSRPLPVLPARREDVYFTGCYTSYLLPESVQATIEVLKAGGINVAHLGEAERCCGEMAKQGGNRKLFKEMASRNVEAMKSAGAKRVIVSCAHCYRTWNIDYPAALGDLPFDVVHIADLISGLVKEGKIAFNRTMGKKVTYHDPCFLRGHQEAPRNILKSIPGIEFQEMERYGRWSYCCGAGGKVTLNAFPEMAKETGKERLLEARAVADTLATSCPTCLVHLKKTAKTQGIDIEIVDLSKLVATTMGLDG